MKKNDIPLRDWREQAATPNVSVEKPARRKKAGAEKAAPEKLLAKTVKHQLPRPIRWGQLFQPAIFP
jgi:hypothetical protein